MTMLVMQHLASCGDRRLIKAKCRPGRCHFGLRSTCLRQVSAWLPTCQSVPFASTRYHLAKTSLEFSNLISGKRDASSAAGGEILKKRDRVVINGDDTLSLFLSRAFLVALLRLLALSYYLRSDARTVLIETLEEASRPACRNRIRLALSRARRRRVHLYGTIYTGYARDFLLVWRKVTHRRTIKTGKNAASSPDALIYVRRSRACTPAGYTSLVATRSS